MFVTVMSRARDAVAIARDLIARHGEAATEIVDKRIQDNRAAADTEAVTFWSQVAQALRALRNG